MNDEAIIDAAHYSVEEILRDGGSIHVRALRPDDRERLLEHFKGLSQQSRYYRFFGLKRSMTDAELVRLTQLDFVAHVGLVATLRDAAGEHFIGVARYIRGADPTRAEVSFAVLDEHQGRGIGSLLLDHLSRIARASGIVELEADVLGDNNRMLEVFAKSGFKVRRSNASGVIHVAFPTAETDLSIEASSAREWFAAAHSVAWILKPRSVAVIGATRDPQKIGGAIVANLKRFGFKGPIYAVNRSAAEVQGLRCYESVSAVGEPIDLAVIAVPAEAVEAEIAECVRAGVHSAVVISAGFAEVSDAGRARQQRMFELVRQSGMRMVGPNCMGVLNTDPAVRLNATFAPLEPPSGNIGMYSQSGALGTAILDHARQRDLGLSSFISAGNRADVSNNDLLAYWADDPNTAVIVLYLESVGNPKKFARLAREVASKKPIVAVKSGHSAAGSRAAASHSGSLASLDVAVDALFEQAGVIRTATLEELFDISAMLSMQPVPAGARVGVVTNAGGPAILLADACEARGLTLPPLAPTTIDRLRNFLPHVGGFTNPIDMTANAGALDYERTIAAVANDPNVDAVVAIYIPPIVMEPEAAAAGIARGAAAMPAHKPILTVFLSTAGTPRELNRGPRGAIPSYKFPENAAMALAAATRYGRWRARPRGAVVTLGRFARETIRTVVDRALEDAATPRWLAPTDLAMMLRAAGIEVALAERATIADAPAVAERLGYPLVAKAIVPGLVHKSAVGCVILDLDSSAAVADAVRTLEQRTSAIGSELQGILLQRQIAGGIEMMAGVTSDATFGPLLTCGLGGTMADLLMDVAFRLHPVSDLDADEMVRTLRSSPMLDGYRGAPAGDRGAMNLLMTRLSALVEVIPELVELDLNPVKLLAPGSGAIVVDGRMLLRPAH
ncbi:MAG: GNAT family N-acetyltransferase [Candidatus Binataceae bacterium]|jgi:acetyl coenzyme A synthetase (ADP forming)-like protein